MKNKKNLQTIEEVILYYRQNPIDYMTQVLDVKQKHVWDKMVEIANAVRDHQNVCVKAGNSLSKSYTVARIALWYLFNYYPATVVTTAPSNIQVEEILWREIRASMAGAAVPLGCEPLKTRLDLQEAFKSDQKWYALGFATKPDNVTDSVTRMQGFHNQNMLVIFDEAAGIIPEIWEAKDRIVTTPSQKFLAIGNPTTSRGPFVDCFKDPTFHKITVSVKDTPNYKENRIVIPGLSGRDFEKQVREKYGEKSNQYKSMITGEIPDEDADSLIPVSLIERAEKAELQVPFKNVKKFVVWDPADGGNDAHVIKSYENRTEVNSLEIRNKKIEEVEPYVWRELRALGGNAIVVDVDGIGRVASGLLNGSKDKTTTIIDFAGSDRKMVSEPETFYNKRHESHWALRNLFEKGEISIADIPEQREELASVKIDNVTERKRAFIWIEDKKELKKRLGRSPGHLDCHVMMAGSYEEIPALRYNKTRYKEEDEVEEYPFNPATA